MKTVTKGWGSELWICNGPLYCGKLLRMDAGKRMSWHYHLLKDETFYVQSGKVLLRYSADDDEDAALLRILTPGEKFHVPRLTRHRLEAVEDAEIFEFSTEHFDSDSIRIVKGD